MKKNTIIIYAVCNIVMIIGIIVYNVIEGKPLNVIGLNLLFSELFYIAYLELINFISIIFKK